MSTTNQSSALKLSKQAIDKALDKLLEYEKGQVDDLDKDAVAKYLKICTEANKALSASLKEVNKVKLVMKLHKTTLEED